MPVGEQINLKTLLDISLDAGKEILNVYKEEVEVELKDDESPLTIADKHSHQAIENGLKASFSDIPILSEEGRAIPYEERKSWNAFWLVDPLDGTKEFIKKNGEFTVNIALIEGRYPMIGVIYAPVLDAFYFSKAGQGAFKLANASHVEIASESDLIDKSTKLPCINGNEKISVVASRSHMSEETELFISEIKEDNKEEVEVVSAGSSLKFCLVAEGKASYYPRFAPTMEWDTGAGQAIVEGAGGKVTRYEDKERFYYNREDLTNGWFLVTQGRD